jgi:hypothetical protein
MKLTIDGREIPLNEEDESCGNKLAIVGCCFCLCTLGLSWVPMCCWCSSMKTKYAGDGDQSPSDNQRQDQQQHHNNNAAFVANEEQDNAEVMSSG